MEVVDFGKKINTMIDKVFDMSIGNTQTAWTKYYDEVDRIINENIDEINNDTADWTVKEWEDFFHYENESGDPALYKFAALKLEELSGGEFFKKCIKDNSPVLINNVYYTSDNTALKRSDILSAAVKICNRIEKKDVKDEIFEAFKMCDPVNEHILYDLAEYIAKFCKDEIPGIILDEGVYGDKLIAILSLCIETNQKSDEIYAAMKTRFKNTPDDDENKDLFVAMFGDYGEPNAIAMIRKYAKKLIENYTATGDRERFTRIMMVASVIEGLGGRTDDIMP